MPTRQLPESPSLDHLKHQARDLWKAHAARDAGAAQRIREFHPRFHDAKDAAIFEAHLSLSDAQLAIAREYGFPSWARLKRHIEQPTLADRLHLPHHERIMDPAVRRAVDLLDQGDEAGLRAHLKEHSNLVRQRVVFEGGNYFRNPALLEFVAENPVRHGRLPANIVRMAKVILEAGAKRDASALTETLGLVASGRVPRECGLQIPLIELLCGYGAEVNAAMHAALVHGESEAAGALIRCGAKLDLTVASATGQTTAEAARLLASADVEERHRALALATQFGHTEIVRLLLEAGEDPNRYNPAGFHSHSTPLHQAAWAGHMEVVRMLVEHGARLDTKDTLWGGTPAGWAAHGGQVEIEKYLRTLEATQPE